jgi:hypothetical protein
LNTHGTRQKDLDKSMMRGIINIKHFIGRMLKIGVE